MAATIKIKNSSTASAVPTSSDLVQGELAVNVTDKRIFTENASGTVVELGTNPTVLTVAADATINGIKVGQGAGSVSSNTAVGASALNSNTTGLQNTSVGQLALRDTVGGTENTAVGRGAAYQNTSGSKIAVLGTLALQGNTTGSNNTALGFSALQANSTASNNTAVGYQAAYSNTTGTITAFGALAGYANTTGTQNTAIGDTSLRYNTTGTGNSGLGVFSLYANTTGGSNVAVGRSALESNTTSSYNTAVGYQAGYAANGGQYNVVLGYQAGYKLTTGTSNLLVGAGAGYELTTGSYNTFVGATTSGIATAGQLVTTGSKNTVLGCYNGNQGGLDIRTASNYIVLSDGDGNPRMYYSTAGGTWVSAEIYASTTASAANLQIAASGTINRSTSALKYKQDIRDVEDFDISALRPVRYKSKCEGDDQTKDHLGLIADEAAESGFDELVTRNEAGEVEGFQYERLTVVLLKKLQVLEAEVKALKGQA